MNKLKGTTVILYEKEKIGVDDFEEDIFREIPVEVENVLISPESSTDIVDDLNIFGKKAVYTLGIPKKDTHNWCDTTVEFFGQKWHTFAFPLEGIEELLPLEWNKKVKVERYGS